MKGEHRIYHDGYSVCYWKGNTACGQEDLWTRATISSSGVGPYQSEFDVDVPHDLGRICALLDKVFVSGQHDKLKEIQRLLGIKP